MTITNWTPLVQPANGRSRYLPPGGQLLHCSRMTCTAPMSLNVSSWHFCDMAGSDAEGRFQPGSATVRLRC